MNEGAPQPSQDQQEGNSGRPVSQRQLRKIRRAAAREGQRDEANVSDKESKAGTSLKAEGKDDADTPINESEGQPVADTDQSAQTEQPAIPAELSPKPLGQSVDLGPILDPAKKESQSVPTETAAEGQTVNAEPQSASNPAESSGQAQNLTDEKSGAQSASVESAPQTRPSVSEMRKFLLGQELVLGQKVDATFLNGLDEEALTEVYARQMARSEQEKAAQVSSPIEVAPEAGGSETVSSEKMIEDLTDRGFGRANLQTILHEDPERISKLYEMYCQPPAPKADTGQAEIVATDKEMTIDDKARVLIQSGRYSKGYLNLLARRGDEGLTRIGKLYDAHIERSQPKPPVDGAADKPAPPESGTVGQEKPATSSVEVPLMITRDMEQKLAAKGLSQDSINKLKPDEAWKIVRGEMSSGQPTENPQPGPQEEADHVTILPKTGPSVLASEAGSPGPEKPSEAKPPIQAPAVETAPAGTKSAEKPEPKTKPKVEGPKAEAPSKETKPPRSRRKPAARPESPSEYVEGRESEKTLMQKFRKVFGIDRLVDSIRVADSGDMAAWNRDAVIKETANIQTAKRTIEEKKEGIKYLTAQMEISRKQGQGAKILAGISTDRTKVEEDMSQAETKLERAESNLRQRKIDHEIFVGKRKRICDEVIEGIRGELSPLEEQISDLNAPRNLLKSEIKANRELLSEQRMRIAGIIGEIENEKFPSVRRARREILRRQEQHARFLEKGIHMREINLEQINKDISDRERIAAPLRSRRAKYERLIASRGLDIPEPGRNSTGPAENVPPVIVGHARAAGRQPYTEEAMRRQAEIPDLQTGTPDELVDTWNDINGSSMLIDKDLFKGSLPKRAKKAPMSVGDFWNHAAVYSARHGDKERLAGMPDMKEAAEKRGSFWRWLFGFPESKMQKKRLAEHLKRAKPKKTTAPKIKRAVSKKTKTPPIIKKTI